MLPIKITLPEYFLEEEIRCGYTIPEQMKEVWAVQLDLLKELVRVCEEHKIEYLAAGGTILGAVRHNGYIPWDDDIDIMMTRENYKKLCEHANEFKDPYFFQTEYSDPGSMRGHAQLRNSHTTAILNVEKEQKFHFNQGVFLDVFPLDNLPDDPDVLDKYLKHLRFCRKLARGTAVLSTRYVKNSGKGIKKQIINILGPIVSRINKVIPISKWTYMYYEKEMQKYNGKRTDKIGIAALLRDDERVARFRTSMIENGAVPMKFEWFEINVPKNYLQYLEDAYGDWQKYVIGGSLHGEVLFDVKRKYLEYIES